MYFLTKDVEQPKFYHACLESDCEPHYFLEFDNARRYIWQHMRDSDKTWENWVKLGCWTANGLTEIEGIGWIEQIIPEECTQN